MDSHLAEGFPLDARVGIDRLRHAGLLEHRPGGRHAFRSDVLREAVAATVSETLARSIHAAALVHYRSSAAPVSHRLPRLARHAAACGDRAEASAAYLACADSARAATSTWRQSSVTPGRWPSWTTATRGGACRPWPAGESSATGCPATTIL
jgi:hypothetical protein